MATFSGPFFAADADTKVEAAIDGIRHDVAEEAEGRVRVFLAAYLKNPTGYYESQVTTDRSVGDRDLVNDGEVIYGPWLEGLGSRNRTTRFKGYGAFRQASQSMQIRAIDMAKVGVAEIVKGLS